MSFRQKAVDAGYLAQTGVADMKNHEWTKPTLQQLTAAADSENGTNGAAETYSPGTINGPSVQL